MDLLNLLKQIVDDYRAGDWLGALKAANLAFGQILNVLHPGTFLTGGLRAKLPPMNLDQLVGELETQCSARQAGQLQAASGNWLEVVLPVIIAILQQLLNRV